MKEKTALFALKGYPDDIARLREIRERLQEQKPDHQVTLADVFRLCVSSGSAVVAGGQVPHGWPPRDRRDG